MDERTNRVSGDVVDAALKIRNFFGPGLFEKVYARCLAHKLRNRGHEVLVEVETPIVYEGMRMEPAYRVDRIVDRSVGVEVKAMEKLLPVHKAQLWTYQKLTGCRVALLINFNTRLLKDELVRLVR